MLVDTSAVSELLKSSLDCSIMRKVLQAHIFSVMRALKKVNPGDKYYEAYKGHSANWGESFTDLYMLNVFIGRVIQPRRILEIGTRTGISLCQLMTGFLEPEIIGSIDSVDPFDDGFISPALVLKNMRHLNLPYGKIMFHQGYSQDVLPGMIRDERQFDYILVDGDHRQEAAFSDLLAAEKLIAPGGIILFDDISDAPGECGLIKVWNKFKNHCGQEIFEFGHDTHGKGIAWAVKNES